MSRKFDGLVDIGRGSSRVLMACDTRIVTIISKRILESLRLMCMRQATQAISCIDLPKHVQLVSFLSELKRLANHHQIA